MKHREEEPPAWPEELNSALRDFQNTRPDPVFVSRLRDALKEGHSAGEARVIAWKWQRWPLWAALLPVTAAAVIALHVGLGGSFISAALPFDLHRFEEMEFKLAPGGGSVFDLELWTHHHDEDDALIVHVDVPETLQVGSPHAVHHDEVPLCEASRCRYRLKPHAEAPRNVNLKVAIAEPGRYRIRVEHVSDSGRVREELLVNARL